MELATWTDQVRRGDPRATARALSEVENRGPRAGALLRLLFPASGRALRIGVTGPPGAGKSTLVDRLAVLLRKQGRSVAVLAIDPSSPFSGGSILGDRVRMQRHCSDDGVFIRSMASRGALGGLAAAAADAMTVLEASGHDVVIIETVGVGQAEVDVAAMASVTALVLTPGAGDDVQAIKAGVMEIADTIVLNKADLPGVDRAESQLLAALALRPDSETPPPEIVRTVASEGRGIEELLAAVEARPRNAHGSVDYWRRRIDADLRRGLAERFLPSALSETQLDSAARRAALGEANPYELVEAALGRLPAATLGDAPVLDHVGVAVESLDAAVAYYRDALGVEPSRRVVVEAERTEVTLLPAGETRLELLGACGSDSPIGRFLARRGPGLHHIALRVADLDAAVARLRNAGARLVSNPVGGGAEGYRYVFLHPKSSGGVLIELIERGVGGAVAGG